MKAIAYDIMKERGKKNRKKEIPLDETRLPTSTLSLSPKGLSVFALYMFH